MKYYVQKKSEPKYLGKASKTEASQRLHGSIASVIENRIFLVTLEISQLWLKLLQ